MFAQFFLLTLILPALSDFTIHQESYQRDCIDLTCPKGAFKQISHPLVKDDLKEAQCTICSQCTDFGFSVCAQSRPNILRFRRDIDSHLCTCANSVPVGCKITQRSAKKDPNTEILNVCYLSTLRTPPKPLALNQENEVIATLEPFWLEPYWKEFQLSQLTLFFEFEVKSPELCDEIGNVTTNEGADPPHICTSSLHMEMTGQDIPDGSKKKDYDPTDFFSQTEDVEYNGEDDDDAPPEVEFARNVFAGAKHVKLWYTVVVKRPRQLNLLKGEQPFQDVTTVLSSENLKFNLESEVYGEGKEPNVEADSEEDESKAVPSTKSTEGHKKINIVDIDGDKDDPDKEDDKEDEEDPISDGTKDDDEDDDEIKSEDDDDDDDDDEEEVKPTDEGKSTPKEEDDDDDDDDDTEATEATKPTDATDEKDKEEKEVKEDEDDEDKDDEDKEDKEDQDKEEQDKEDKEDEDKEDKEDEEKDDSADDDSAADILDDVNAGNETSSFFEEHFGSWPLVRVGIVLTLVACILIIAAACCYRYRGCCCYSDQQKFTTKTSNGYEYHVTGQAGQEMVGPPETEKLTH